MVARTPQNIVLSVEEQRRIAAGFLINEMGATDAEAAKAAGFARADDAAKWAARLRINKHAKAAGGRGPKGKLVVADGRALGAALSKDKIGRGVKRVAASLVKSGKIGKASERTYLKALRAAGYDVSMSSGDIQFSDEQEKARVAFCRRVRIDRLGYRCSFSDSKIFCGGVVHGKGKARLCWAPKGESRVFSRARPPYQAPHTPACLFPNFELPPSLFPFRGGRRPFRSRPLRRPTLMTPRRAVAAVAGARVRRNLGARRELAPLRHRHHRP